MNLKTYKKENNLIVVIKGEIDHHTAESVREKIDDDYFKYRCKNIVFDFKKVSLMDSSGIGMVIGRYKKVKFSGGKVIVAEANETVKKIFEMSGLNKIIDFYKDLETAICVLGGTN